MNPADGPSGGQIEGRLIAQRRVLAALVAAVLDEGGGARERLARLVSRDALDGSHAEDPGSVPDPAFGLLAAEDDELRRIARRAAEILAAGDGQ